MADHHRTTVEISPQLGFIIIAFEIISWIWSASVHFFVKKNVFILFEKNCFLGKSHQIGLIMLNSFPSLKCWHDVWKPTLPSFKDEPLPGVLGNKGTGAFIFREQGIFSNYFQGTRELLNRLLGTREHQSNLSVKWGWQACTTPQRVF